VGEGRRIETRRDEGNGGTRREKAFSEVKREAGKENRSI
jgi:hypothetical protein